MIGSAEILAAFRELSNVKQLDRAELYGLLQDGIMAALSKKYGPNVQAEVDIDDGKGDIRIVLLKTVVESVEDPSREIAVEDARVYDEGFEAGEVMEEPIDFAVFGRAAVQAAKQRIIQRVREGERTRIRDEFATRVGDLLSGEIQQIERGKLVVMLNKFREAEAIIPYREQNHREHFHQGEPIRAVLKRVEETPKGPRLILSRSDPLFVQALFKLEVPEIQQGIVEIKAAAREHGSRTKIAVYSSREWLERGGEGQLFAPLPEERDTEADVRLAKIEGIPAATVAILEEAGYKTLNDIIDLERDDYLRLAGITPGEADRII